MHIRVITPVLVAITVLGCQIQPVEEAPAGSPPAITTPVGPVPGVAEQPASQLNPFSKDPIALAEGRKLFLRYNCYGCHGGHAGGGMGPSLRDETWIYGSSDAHVYSSIAEGRANGMPAWGTRLPQEEIWKLVAYIKSMRTPLEPDPPEQQ